MFPQKMHGVGKTTNKSYAFLYHRNKQFMLPGERQVGLVPELSLIFSQLKKMNFNAHENMRHAL